MPSTRQSNDLGGVSIFRDIDLPEAYQHQVYHDAEQVARSDLEEWFSPARMSRYLGDVVGARYIWNTRVSKAFLEDIGHIEVLLRNFIDTRLSKDSQMRCWWQSERYHLGGFRHNVNKAVKRIERHQHEASAEQIVASLSLDNWRFLLTPKLEATIWRALINPTNGGMPHYPGHNRARFEDNVELIRNVRNRASHQEPLIGTGETPHHEITRLCSYLTAIDTVARNINPKAANWIASQSRIPDVLAQRPN